MNERRYAVLIASSQFEDQCIQNLWCPENDVDGLNELLMSKDYGNFSESIPLKNKPHHEILLEIEQIIENASRNDLVLIYYSGHGKQDSNGNLYLATTNTRTRYLKSTSIPIDSIKTYIAASRINKVIIILDCCYSGLVGKAFLKGGIDEQLQSLSSGNGIFIMTASTGTQIALENRDERYGVFTKHIVEGIHDWKATNDDGYITMNSLYSYVNKQMMEDGHQNPMKWDFNINGEIVIARNRRIERQRNEWDSLSLALTDDDEDIRWNAVQILAKLKDQRTITSLIHALNDRSDIIQEMSSKTLREIGKPAIRPLILALNNDDHTRDYAANILLSMGKNAVGQLILALDADNSQIRARSAIVLGEIKDRQAVKPLIKSLEDNSSDVRCAAAWALGEMRESSAIESLISALNDEDHRVRVTTVRGLGKIGDIRSIGPLTQFLNDGNAEVRANTIEALGNIKDPRTEELLIQMLTDIDSNIRIKTAYALKRIGGLRSVESLIKALNDDNPNVRTNAIEALGNIKDSRAIGPIIGIFKLDKKMRKNAGNALANIGAQAIEPLSSILKENDSDIRENALDALGKINDQRVIEPLIQALGDDDSHVRFKAVCMLGNTGDSRAVEPLIFALNDKDPEIRERTAIALGDLNNVRAIEPLVRAVKRDWYEFVREAAALAVGRIKD